MKNHTKLLIVILVAHFFQCCDNPKPKQGDFIGMWKAKDGATIELRDDSSYAIKKFNLSNVYILEKENTIIDFDGNWKQVNYEDFGKKIKFLSDFTYKDFGINETYIENGKEYSHKINFDLEIFGHGLFENKQPWYIFSWIGDPDDMNKYKFEKQ